MSSTSAKQAAAAQRRRQAARCLPNTTTWVDEDYAQRLARQFHAAVLKGETPAFFFHLSSIRRHACYCAEQPCADGTEVVFFDGARGPLNMLAVGVLRYDERGRLRRGSVFPTVPYRVCLSQHAQRRLFERLRTNSRADLARVCRRLTALPPCADADLGRELALELPEGTARCIVDRLQADAAPIWIVKTFVAEARAPARPIG